MSVKRKSTTSKRKRASTPVAKDTARVQIISNPGDAAPVDYRRSDYEAKQAAYETSEKWVEFARSELDNGREIPFVDVPEAAGEMGRASVARTDELYRQATRRTFAVPHMPWKDKQP